MLFVIVQFEDPGFTLINVLLFHFSFQSELEGGDTLDELRLAKINDLQQTIRDLERKLQDDKKKAEQEILAKDKEIADLKKLLREKDNIKEQNGSHSGQKIIQVFAYKYFENVY